MEVAQPVITATRLRGSSLMRTADSVIILAWPPMRGYGVCVYCPTHTVFFLLLPITLELRDDA